MVANEGGFNTNLERNMQKRLSLVAILATLSFV
ncbi:MAG: hypothetical protein ACI814_004053, partial [Mariniblastus sp.]